ncbi:hypothetical protein [Flavobacterium sp.]|uniref:hypothetical protein n=1 Tax=Flavobacterium sp. TaxID=239 RepID=UPI003D6B6F79
MVTVSINGKSITTDGGNIRISGNKVFVDGKDVTNEFDSKEINVVVTGNIEYLKVDACNKITITGDVKSVETQSGDVGVSGNVGGSIKTMSGDVDCQEVSGNISTMSGDVKYRKPK